MPNHNDALNIVGSSDEPQLLIQGSASQTDPLQEWQLAGAESLARITGDGRFQVGSFDNGVMATDESLIEAHRIETDVTKPKRGLHLLGAITGALDTAVAWAVKELTLRGSDGLDALHTALRIRLRNETSGLQEYFAELRGADVEVTHAGTESGATIEQVMGLQVSVNHEGSATSTTAYGLKVNLTNPSSGAYALHANHGKVYLGDLGTGIVQAIGGELSTVEDLPGGAVELAVTWGEAISLRNAVYLSVSDNKWYKTDSDASGTVKMGKLRGFVSDAGTGAANSAGVVQVSGLLEGFSGLTAGAPLYAGTTAGTYTQTKPTVTAGSGQIIISEMGYAVSATEVWIDPQPIHYLKRESLATNATTTLTHHSDVQGHSRTPEAYVSHRNDVLAESYATGNWSKEFQLRGQSGAGGTTTVSATGGTAYPVGDVSNLERNLAQSFQVPAGKLSSVSYQVLGKSGTPTGANYIGLSADNGSGNPGSTLGGYELQTPVINSTNTVNFSDGPFLNSGTTYWVSWTPDAFQATNTYYNFSGTASSVYANGVLKYDYVSGGTWQYLYQPLSGDLCCSITTVAQNYSDKIAQGVKHSTDLVVSTINLYLKKYGTPTGDLTCTLYSDNAGSPGSVIANGTSNTVSAATVGTSYALVPFTFAGSPLLLANTLYHLVLSTTDSASNTNYVVWGGDNTSPSYANGVLKTLVSGIWTAAGADGIFEMYGSLPSDIYDEPLTIGQWDGGPRDLAVRYDNGSGSNSSTQTTYKNVSGATLDMTCEVVFD